MTNFLAATELKQKRLTAGLPGRLVCVRAGVDRSRLSDIERGYLRPSTAELMRINRAIDELIEAKRKVAKAAAEYGWPLTLL
jgi:transcriptional regulator with XRE-family HTH domain